MKIAICDNDPMDLSRLQEAVADYYAQGEYEKPEIFRFSSGQALLASMQEELYDLFFLDVLMPGMNGMELGRRLREQGCDAVIVYVTTSREFAFEAYGVHALRYLEKPVKKEEVREILQQIEQQQEKQNARTYVGIQTRTGIRKVCIEELLYIENAARAALYKMKNGEQVQGICNRGSFEDMVKLFAEHPDFIHPHKSYFVNLRHVRSMQNTQLILDGGMEIPISRNRYMEVKKEYLKFLAGGAV